MTRPVEEDDFALAVEKILSRVRVGADEIMPKVVSKGVKRSALLWRKKAAELWPSGSKGHTYRKGGKTYHTGKYSRSIRSHMIQKDGTRPSGEAGVPKMPGLAHLLEDGHARIGGGRTRAFPHVRDAAEEAFDYTTKLADDEVDRMLNEI